MVVDVFPVRVGGNNKCVLALGKTHGQFVAPPFLTVYILDTSVLFVMNIYIIIVIFLCQDGFVMLQQPHLRPPDNRKGVSHGQNC